MLRQVFKNKIAEKQGFTLIEVLIFISVVSVVLITGASLALTSLYTLKNQQYKTIAQYHAVALLNWLELEKEKDWTNFVNRLNPPRTSSPGQETFCFYNLQWPQVRAATTGKPCTDDQRLGLSPGDGQKIFKREAKFKVDDQKVQVAITVSWEDPTGENEIEIKREFRQIER